MDMILEKNSPQEKHLYENCIELDVDLENSMLYVSLPNSIKIILPISTVAKNSEYINCFYKAVANKSMKFVNKNIINLDDVGWTFIDPIQISMFFYWLGSPPIASNQIGNVSLLIFFILSDYFQLSEIKRKELISMLSTSNLGNAYPTMKSFLTRRYIPWYLFKEILKAEMNLNTIKTLTFESVNKNQMDPGIEGGINPRIYNILINQGFQGARLIQQGLPQSPFTIIVDSLQLICLKILLDWYDEKNMKIDNNFPIPCFNEVNEFIRENRAKLIPNDPSIIIILSHYSNVHRVIDLKLYFEALYNIAL